MPEDTILAWVSHYGYLVIFFLLVFGIVGLPVPDETLLTLIGYLSYRGDLRLVPSFSAAFLGSLCGITLSYVLGRTGGVLLLRKYGRRLHLKEERVERIHRWLDGKGGWGLIIGYFIPGVRHLVAFVAGSSRMEYSVFAAFAYTGGFIWSTSFLAAGYWGGKGWERLQGKIHLGLSVLIGVILLVAIAFYIRRSKCKHGSSR
jgi:membrane protein DedA with SNARE-associated domain